MFEEMHVYYIVSCWGEAVTKKWLTGKVPTSGRGHFMKHEQDRFNEYWEPWRVFVKPFRAGFM